MELPSRFFLPLVSAAVFAASLLLGWYGRGFSSSRIPQPSERTISSVLPAPNAELTSVGRTFDQAIAATDESDYRRALRLAEAASALGIEETVAALERQHARIGKRYDYSGDVTAALLARYAELDPAAATLWLLQSYPHGLRDQWTQATLGTWLTQDREAALKWARGLPASSLRRSVYARIFERLTTLDPAAAEQQAVALGADNSQLDILYRKLAEKDLPIALAHVMKLPARRAKEFVGSMVNVWARRDVPAALAWAGQLPSGSVRSEALDSLYRTWIAQDPSTAAAYLEAQGEGAMAKFSDAVVSAWVEHDLDAARRWAERLPSKAREEALTTVVSTWAERDPRAAAAYAVARFSPGKTQMIEDVADSWQEADFPAAFGWIEAMPPGEVRDSVRAKVCGRWADRDPRACLDYLYRQADGKVDDLIEQCVRGWAGAEPEEAWQWSRGLTNPTRREHAGTAAVSQIAYANPVRAGALFGQLSVDGNIELASKIASSWVKTDAPGLQQWAVALPAGEARDAAWRAMLSDWGKNDPRGAAAWIEARPADASKDAGIVSLIGDGETLATDVGLRLVKLVADEDARGPALHAVLQHWLAKDRAAATTWIQQAPELTPETRDKLLVPPAKPDISDE